MTREQIYKTIYKQYVGYYRKFPNVMEDTNPLLSLEDNISRKANLKAVADTEIMYQILKDKNENNTTRT